MSEKLFPKLIGALKRARLDKLAGAVLSGTPVGAGINVVTEIIDIFGTDDDDALAQGIENMEPDQRVQVMALEVEMHKNESLERISLEEEITKRHAADMSSDSRFTKMVRPLMLTSVIGVTLSYFISLLLLAFFGPQDVDADRLVMVSDGAEFLKDLSKWFAGFYVSGRTYEKTTKANLGEKVKDLLRKLKRK